jgi:hypothetical protein
MVPAARSLELELESMRSMRMRLPSRSAQIKPTSRSRASAFLTVAAVLDGIVLLGIDEARRDEEPGGAVARFRRTLHHMSMILSMRARTLVFTFFAAAMLFSMVREWSVPIGCPRLVVTRHR